MLRCRVSDVRPLPHLLLLFFIGASASTAFAAELTDAARQAYEEYFGRARQSFLARLKMPPGTNGDGAALQEGRTTVRPGGGDGILSMPESLIHHWRGALFIRGVTLDEVLRISRDYREYPKIFPPVLASTVLSQDGDALRVQFRMRESGGGMTAILDVRSTVRYVRLDATHAYGISTSDEIREVKDAGRATEHRLPPGRDSGYLWRAATFTRFIEDDGGVYMEMETIGLSRRFPPLLGWLIEPIARRIGRRSVEDSVQQFRRAVLMRHASKPAATGPGAPGGFPPVRSGDRAASRAPAVALR